MNPQRAQKLAHSALDQLRCDEVGRFAEIANGIEAGTFRTGQCVELDSVAAADASDVRRRVLASTLRCVYSRPSDQPRDEQTAALTTQIEDTQRRNEAWVENYYRKLAPAFLPAHLLFGADHGLRGIVARSLAAYDNFFSAVPNGGIVGSTDVGNHQSWPWMPYTGAVAISTSRPSHRWLIDGEYSLNTVFSEILHDVWCDFDQFGNGTCVEKMLREREDKRSPFKSDYLTLEYMSNVARLLPFAVGDLVIFTRICHDCWNDFLDTNNIDAEACEISEFDDAPPEYDDGFGEL